MSSFLTRPRPPASPGCPMGLIANVPTHLGGAIDRDGVDKAGRQELFDELVAAQYEKGKALAVAGVYEIDDVIDPVDTRPGSPRPSRPPPSASPPPRPPERRHLVSAARLTSRDA
jgi:hypothetical protein